MTLAPMSRFEQIGVNTFSSIDYRSGAIGPVAVLPPAMREVWRRVAFATF
jgi:hypothetical protein